MTAWGQAGAVAPADSSVTAHAYEVVSIKPDKSGGSDESQLRLPNGFRLTNFPLRTLVYRAYDIVLDSQVSGLPEWMRLDRYDVEAKVGADTAEAWKKLSYEERWKQERPMVQTLLADRCHMKVHREARELPVYDLVIAKGGLKMKEAPAGEGDGETTRPGKIAAQANPMESLVNGLSGVVGRMIVDKTGLGDKKFDFNLQWTPDDQRGAADAGPSIFTALEEQLGLKLVPDKGLVDVLVIDHIERPSPN